MGDESVALQIRLFRLCCATTGVLCLGIVMPMNLVQNLSLWVHIANILIGLTGGYCFFASLRGRHFLFGFLSALVLLLNPVWFFNGGSTGSIPFYFFPVLLYAMVILRGWSRRIWTVAIVADVCGLIVLEYFFPSLTTPFQSGADRIIDLSTGVLSSAIAVAAIVRLILASYDREQRRLSRYAEQLAASERNYREIFNATSDALAIRDMAGRLVDCNERLCVLYGCDRATLVLRSINDLSLGAGPYAQAEAEEKIRRTFAEGPQVFVWRSRRNDGGLFWSEVALRAGEIAGEKRLIVSIRDVSRRVQAEEALRQQEERLRLALEASHQGWFDINVQTGEGRASAEYAKMIGREAVDFAVSAREWMEGVHPLERESATTAFSECILTGQTRTLQYRRKTRSGEWIWIRSVGKIVEFDTGGKALRMLGTHTDITELKELEARLQHTQRLESVATLAGGVAHDLNNVLTPMLMATEVFHGKLADERDRELMADMAAGARRGAAIIRQLLVFSRSVAPVRAPVDVAQLVRGAAAFARANFRAGAVVVENVPAGLWSVTADAAQLRQALENLCINAGEAMPTGGTLTLSAENSLTSPRASTQNPWGKGVPSVMITVADTGRGIPRHIIGRIFDPFYTTKEVGKGVGLGLSSAHGMVIGHGGSITVESEPGRGATFRIFIPATRTAVPKQTVP